MYPEEFKQDEFNQYVEEHSNDDKITNGIFAPWMMYKKEFEEILKGISLNMTQTEFQREVGKLEVIGELIIKANK